jgi:hypothetical protein
MALATRFAHTSAMVKAHFGTATSAPIGLRLARVGSLWLYQRRESSSPYELHSTGRLGTEQ